MQNILLKNENLKLRRRLLKDWDNLISKATRGVGFILVLIIIATWTFIIAINILLEMFQH